MPCPESHIVSHLLCLKFLLVFSQISVSPQSVLSKACQFGVFCVTIRLFFCFTETIEELMHRPYILVFFLLIMVYRFEHNDNSGQKFIYTLTFRLEPISRVVVQFTFHFQTVQAGIMSEKRLQGQLVTLRICSRTTSPLSTLGLLPNKCLRT